MASTALTSCFSISTIPFAQNSRLRTTVAPVAGAIRRRRGSQPLNESLEVVTRGVGFQRRLSLLCRASKGGEPREATEMATEVRGQEEEEESVRRAVTRVALWVMAGVYTSYLFLLPFAPGDPVWAISPATIAGVLNLSFNFFYVLPLANLVGFHLVEAAVVHPTDEALFNLVLGWAFLFAPLIFTDRKRDRFTGSLDAFWLASMFLTNTFLIPYMAIRLNNPPPQQQRQRREEPSQLQRFFTHNAKAIALTGAAVGVTSVLWFLFGRPTEGYGDIAQRWSYWTETAANDRPTYAFLWDLACYAVFQPWLIGANLGNVRGDWEERVRWARWVPFVGLVAYCWGLEPKGKAP